jgi:alkanesulfonate monooxygenase SsuD/methylene tetrahydromethanopterin reductase-like flavin-dependent oxidoreductase (luciferase family)
MDVGLQASVIRRSGDSRPLVELYSGVVDIAVQAEQWGFDFFWVGEHHFAPNQWNPSPLPLLAAIASRTSTLRLGTNVIVAPYHNPIRLAEDIATVDLLSGGRLDVVLGTGSIRDEFETFAVPEGERWGRTFETLEILRRSFSEEQFDHQGRYFEFPNVRMTTQPVQHPMPLWMASAGPKTIARVGRAGYHLQTPVLAAVDEFWDIYRAAALDAGHDPDATNYHVFTGGQVAASWTDDVAAAYEARTREFMGFYQTRETVFAGTAHDVDTEHPASTGVTGTPDDVLTELEGSVANSALTHLGWTLGPPDSLRLLAREVVPTMKTWGRAPIRPASAS